MNPTIQCIVLLTCITICNSAFIPNRCMCLNRLQRIRPSLIMDVIDYKPHEYCSNHEVIVILKDGDKLCLDPNSKFTKALLQAKKGLVKSSTTQSPQSLPEKSEPQAWLTSDPTAK